MTAVLICRTAEEDAVVDALAHARALRRAGEDVVVVVAGAALAAMDDGTFSWSHNFISRDGRARVIKGAERVGLALADRERDPRWSDVRSLIASEAGRSDMRIVACPLWLELLGLHEAPSPLEQLTEAEYISALLDARVVLGGQ